MTNRLEYTTARDLFFDFCLWPYKPVVPHESKFRSVNLLFHSLDVMGVHEGVFELVQAIREGIGVSRTVWGVKQLGDDISWEFYFPLVPCDIKANENHHYFMFSIAYRVTIIALVMIRIWMAAILWTGKIGTCWPKPQ